MTRVALGLAVGLAALACRKPAPPPPLDVPAAVAQARAAGKRILIVVADDGPKSRSLAAVYEKKPALAALRDANFIVVAARDGLEKLPAPGALPHLYVLDQNGSLIESESGAKLEKDGAYDPDRVEFFLKAFGPPKK